MSATGRHTLPGTEAAPTSVGSIPLWILAGQMGLVVTFVLGFGAMDLGKPKIGLALLVLATAAMVVLGPIRNIERIVISMPALLYLTWWTASYLWTFNVWVWVRDTQSMLPFVACLTAIGTMLPYRDVRKGLVMACYAAIGWTIIYTLLHFGVATTHPDGAPGWRGGFIHKNGMAPFMLLAVLVIAHFEPRRLWRQAGVATALAFILLSQSTTSLVVGVLLLAFSWFLRRLARSPREHWSFILTTGSASGLLVAYLAVMNLPTLVGAAGKDPTLTSRTEIWEGALEVIGRRPWTGYGIGGVWINNAAEPTRTILDGLGFIVYHSHNGFIEIMLQLGLVGLALFVVLLVAYYRTNLALLPHDRTSAMFFMLYGGLIVLLSITEVATFGVWLALLCAFHAIALKELRGHEATA